MVDARKKLGYRGEKIAANFLRRQGYQIIEKNYHSRLGEIDMVAKENESIVFVEVKTRRSKTYGYPEESITSLKRVHMINASQAYLVENPELGGNWQIDVISIRQVKPESSEIIHFENAISE